jgi:6-hydroxymethylpterin diphosphokinase MptE-like protein
MTNLIAVYVSDPRVLASSWLSPIDVGTLHQYGPQLQKAVRMTKSATRKKALAESLLEHASEVLLPELKSKLDRVAAEGKRELELVIERRAFIKTSLPSVNSYLAQAEGHNSMVSRKSHKKMASTFASWKRHVRTTCREVTPPETENSAAAPGKEKKRKKKSTKQELKILILLPEKLAFMASRIEAFDSEVDCACSIGDLAGSKKHLVQRCGSTLHFLLDEEPFFIPARFGDGLELPHLEPYYGEIRKLYQVGFRRFEFFSENCCWGKDHLDEQDLKSLGLCEGPELPSSAARNDVETSGIVLPSRPNGMPPILKRVRHRMDMFHAVDEFVNRHKGRRAFVMGNGPSLANMDLTKLKGEITFGANQVYLGFEKWGFETDYWTITDRLQIEKYYGRFNENLKNSSFMKFIPISSHALFDFQPETTCIMHHSFVLPKDEVEFSLDPFVINTGKSVVFVMMQLAAIMGCDPIIMIGVDHRYNVPAARAQKDANVKVSERVIASAPGNMQKPIPVWGESDAAGPTHFDPRYAKDRLFHAPDVDKLGECLGAAWSQAREQGITILNATPGTALETVPKTDFDSLF